MSAARKSAKPPRCFPRPPKLRVARFRGIARADGGVGRCTFRRKDAHALQERLHARARTTAVGWRRCRRRGVPASWHGATIGHVLLPPREGWESGEQPFGEAGRRRRGVAKLGCHLSRGHPRGARQQLPASLAGAVPLRAFPRRFPRGCRPGPVCRLDAASRTPHSTRRWTGLPPAIALASAMATF